MRCPVCGHDNTIPGIFCEVCGASLESSGTSSSEATETSPTTDSSPLPYTDPSVYEYYAEQYQAPPPPPLNGHNKILPSPQLSTDERESYTRFGRQSRMVGDFRVYEERPQRKVFRVFRSIIYFAGIFLSGFWLLAAFVQIDQNGALPYIGLVAWLVMIVGSPFLFIRLRRRHLRLSFSRFLVGFVVATVATFLVLVIENAVVPDIANNTPASFILAMILAFYCLVIAILAVW